MIDEKEIYSRKNGFVLYKNYVKQVSKMTNEQAGELFKMILHYVNTFEMPESIVFRESTESGFSLVNRRTAASIPCCAKTSAA